MTLSLRTTSFLFTLVLSLFMLSLTEVMAQGAGVRISPAIIEETLDPGETKQYFVEVESLGSADQEYFVFTRNIKSVGPGGEPVFAETNEATGFELADWITLSERQVTVPGGGEVVIPFELRVPENAQPGSHFGGVFISADPPDIERSGAAVGYQVANIVSIRVSGDAVEEANIRQFATTKFIYGTQDVDFDVRIENTGNVLVRPTGPLEIFNSLGKKVGTVNFNEREAAVFPGDTRQFEMVNWLGDSVGFGRYEAILTPVYGEEGVARRTMSSTVSFWILPIGIIGPALGILAVVLLVTFFGVRLYIKRTLAQMNAGRRVVRRKSGGGGLLLIVVSMLTIVALFLVIMLLVFA